MQEPNQPQEPLIRQEAFTAKNQPPAETRMKSGANWFFWIGGLSVINSIIVLTGSTWNFIVGLGITQIIDAIAWTSADASGSTMIQYIGLAANISVAAVFCMFGYFARQRKEWGFIAGMILYGLDAFLFILAFDILGLGFHAFALFMIYGGYKALKELPQPTPAQQLPVQPYPHQPAQQQHQNQVDHW